MTILTQNKEELVNYDHVLKIKLYGDVVVDENIGEVDVAVIKALLDNGKKVVLGAYAEVEQLDEVLKDLTQWLNEKNDYKLVFRMPEPQIYVDEESNEEPEKAVKE